MSDTKKITSELNIISKYLGLISAKYAVLILIAIIFYPMRPIPVYIFATAIIFPLLLQTVITPHDKANDPVNNFTLYPTACKYHITYKKYKCEKFNSTLIMFLLILWQLSINFHSSYKMPLSIVPAVILAIYVSVRVIASIYFKLKLHYDFMHLNI